MPTGIIKPPATLLIFRTRRALGKLSQEDDQELANVLHQPHQSKQHYAVLPNTLGHSPEVPSFWVLHRCYCLIRKRWMYCTRRDLAVAGERASGERID